MSGLAAALQGRTRTQRESRIGLSFVSPTLLVVLLVVVFPVLWTFLLSFQQLRVSDLDDVGVFQAQYTLENFAQVLTSRDFLSGLRTTLIYSVFGTASAIGLGLVAALVVRRPFRGRTLVRGFMLLPYVAPVVSVAFIWRIMLNPQFGVVNAIGADVFGWDRPVAFLTQRSTEVGLLGLNFEVPLALLMVILFEAWRSFPFAFLFILARLQALPADLDEAAKIDGAAPSQRFRHIVLPQLSGVIALLALLRFIWTFNSFDEIYLLTGGGAGTDVVSVQAFQYLTARNDVGRASALSVVLALILMVLLIVYLRVFVRGRGEQA